MIKLLQEEMKEECPLKHPLRDILVHNYAQLATYHRNSVTAPVRSREESARDWSKKLVPALRRKLGGVNAEAEAYIGVEKGSAIVGVQDGEHPLWDGHDLHRVTCLVVYGVEGLCADLPSLAHVVAQLPTNAWVVFAHGFNKAAIFSRDSVLDHCADPWAAAREDVWAELERGHCYRLLHSIGSSRELRTRDYLASQGP